MQGIRMVDTRVRKPTRQISAHLGPAEPAFLVPAPQRTVPELEDRKVKGAHGAAVHRDAVVPIVPGDDRSQVPSLVRDGLMPSPPELQFQLLQFRCPSLSHRLPKHRECPFLRLPADMRETEKVECLGLTVASPSPVLYCIPPELDEARLLRMQLQPELRESLTQLGQELLGLVFVFKAQRKVIGETDDNDVPKRLLPSL